MDKIAYKHALRKKGIKLIELLDYLEPDIRAFCLEKTKDILAARVSFIEVIIGEEADHKDKQAISLDVEGYEPHTNLMIKFRRKKLSFIVEDLIQEIQSKKKFELSKEEKLQNLFSPIEEDGFTQIELDKIQDIEENLYQQTFLLTQTPFYEEKIADAYAAYTFELAAKEDEPVKWVYFVE